MCRYFHKSTSVTITGGNLVIAFNNATGVLDKDNFCFTICQSLPAGYQALPVVLVVNGVNVPLLNKYSNPTIGSELSTKRGYIYKGYYGTTATPHVNTTSIPVACNCTCSNVCW